MHDLRLFTLILLAQAAAVLSACAATPADEHIAGSSSALTLANDDSEDPDAIDPDPTPPTDCVYLANGGWDENTLDPDPTPPGDAYIGDTLDPEPNPWRSRQLVKTVDPDPTQPDGLALAIDPVWVSGRSSQARFCAGCHEAR